MKKLSTIFKVVLFTIIAVALYREIYVNGAIVTGAFHYFTIQSNMLLEGCLLLFIFTPWESRAKCLIRGTSLLAITLTFLTYNFILYKIFLDWGTIGYTFSRTVTHVVAPIGFVLDWLVFDKHNMMKLKDIFIWLSYPLAYCLFSLYIGLRHDYYIYFFFNVSNGYGSTLKWLVILLCVLFIISFLYLGLDKCNWKPKGKNKTT